MLTLNVESENEHFEISDSIISWIENYKNSACLNGHHDGNETTDEPDETDMLKNILPPPTAHHQLSAPGVAWNLVKIFSEKQGLSEDKLSSVKLAELQQIRLYENSPSPHSDSDKSPDLFGFNQSTAASDLLGSNDPDVHPEVRVRGNDEWAPPRPQIIFNIHEDTNFRRLMQRQNYRCAGCGTLIDLELARRLVLYCHYLGKYFCKCCFSHKAIHLPGYILQKWNFNKYPVSHFALQLLDRIANEPLFNINDINSSLYRRVKKLKHLVDIRMQLYYLKIYISTCTQTDKLSDEYTSFTHQHLLQDDVHLYSLNNLIEIQHGKLYEYLNDLVTRSIAHIAQCDRCRAKGHYCQLCGPSSLMSSMISSSQTGQSGTDQQPKLKHSSSIGQNILSVGTNLLTKVPTSEGGVKQQGNHSRSSSGNYSSSILSANLTNSGLSPNGTTGGLSISPSNHAVADHELIFPFEIGRVAQCLGCGCCFHIQCFMDAGQNCPKCERMQRRKVEMVRAAAFAGGSSEVATIEAQLAGTTVGEGTSTAVS